MASGPCAGCGPHCVPARASGCPIGASKVGRTCGVRPHDREGQERPVDEKSSETGRHRIVDLGDLVTSSSATRPTSRQLAHSGLASRRIDLVPTAIRKRRARMVMSPIAGVWGCGTPARIPARTPRCHAPSASVLRWRRGEAASGVSLSSGRRHVTASDRRGRCTPRECGSTAAVVGVRDGHHAAATKAPDPMTTHPRCAPGSTGCGPGPIRGAGRAAEAELRHLRLPAPRVRWPEHPGELAIGEHRRGSTRRCPASLHASTATLSLMNDGNRRSSRHTAAVTRRGPPRVECSNARPFSVGLTALVRAMAASTSSPADTFRPALRRRDRQHQGARASSRSVNPCHAVRYQFVPSLFRPARPQR